MLYFYGIIPARYSSSRFPGKPLADIGDKPMIQHVYENALKCRFLKKLIVATDDQRIIDKVEDFGGLALMTSKKHVSGTDRVYEAAQKIVLENDQKNTIIVNIQGDEPFIEAKVIDQLAMVFNNPNVQIATLIKKFDNDEDLLSDTCIKVVTSTSNEALYFSRSVIPYIRSSNKTENLHTQFPFKQHIGIYAYRMDVLAHICKLGPSAMEEAESLEQLRWLENGYKVHVGESSYEGHSIDVPDDIKKLKKAFPEQFKK